MVGPVPEDGEVTASNPYAHRRAWGPQARVAARSRLTEAIDSHAGLFGVVEASAQVVCAELGARTVTVTLLEDNTYRDLVKVGDYSPEEAIDPTERFSADLYPEATARLLARQNYVSGEAQEFHSEHIEIVPPNRVSAFMGIPIVAEGEVRGEVFITRKAGEPSFTSDDIEVARDLATQLGVHFPKLLSEQIATDPDW